MVLVVDGKPWVWDFSAGLGVMGSVPERLRHAEENSTLSDEHFILQL